MALIFYYTASGTELSSLSQAVRALQEEGHPLEIIVRTAADVFDSRQEERLAALAQGVQALVLVPHGGPKSLPGFEKVLSQAKDAQIIHVQPVGGSDEDLALVAQFARPKDQRFERRVLYLKYGGPENLKNFFLDLYTDLTGQALQVASPKPLPTEGIYHPEGGVFEDLSAYLGWLESRPLTGLKGTGEIQNFACPPKPLVGIWFYQGYWVNEDLEPINALVREIEASGGLALPVFHRRFVEPGEEALKPAQVAERFFCQGKKPFIQALISLQPFSQTLLWPETKDIYPNLGVPVLQGLMSFSPRAVWEEEAFGLSPMELCISVAQPEFDGCLITTLIATREELEEDQLLGTKIRKYRPIPERVRKLARMALNWARLKRMPPSKRRVAIVFHHYPPRADRMGCAFGLDSFESVVRLLKHLKKEGYRVDRLYENGEELAQEMLSVLISDRRYLSPTELAKRAAASLDEETAKRWHAERPKGVRQKMEADWGPPPGKVFVHRGCVLFGGIFNGNIFLTLQPPRGHLERLEELSPAQLNLHDPDLSPTHHYLFFYRWLAEEFGAHAVVHVGKHGSLEWLPGKAVALSENCYPDQAIRELPNIYPYIVNDPGEGTQAKRRSFCAIIDHMIPPQMAAGRYGELEEIAEKIAEWQILCQEDPPKAKIVLEKIWNLVEKARLDDDLKLTQEKAFKAPEVFVSVVHDYLEEVAETQVNDGLHILGEPPKGPRFYSTLAYMVKVPVEGRPSPHEVLKRLEPELSTLERLNKVEEMLRQAVEEDKLPEDRDLAQVVSFVKTELVPRLRSVREEMTLCLQGLSGGFVPPGPSGAPTRGAFEVLPTGRNFYSVDPMKIPTPEAWEQGMRQAQALLTRHLQDHGRYPRALAMVIWGSPTMRTRGDDVAEALYLLGVRPVWHPTNHRVEGLKVIPLEDLGRPRIDVTLRTSGFFRDAFPNLLELLDQAVGLVASLDEPPEKNFVAAHVAEEARRLKEKGLSQAEAFRLASLRVFSDRPGAYGAGIPEVLDAGKWERPEDLGEVYINWGGYAYGKGLYGEEARDAFRQVLSRVEVTLKNEDSREMDIFSSDDFNAYHGGLNTAVLVASGKKPISYTGDSSDPKAPKVRTTAEEARFIFRVRVLNPRWIEGMKRHGYKGAGDLSRLVDICFQWDATTKVLDDWMYAKLAETYALDPEMQEFFRKHNPYALLNITERLLEAAKRGLWKEPRPEMLEKLKDLFLKMEAEVE